MNTIPSGMAARVKAKRRFIDTPSGMRCQWEVTLKDGSKAQCGRARKVGQLCTQHLKMHAKLSCDYCGMSEQPEALNNLRAAIAAAAGEAA